MGGRGGLPDTPEVQGDTDELLHLPVVPGPDLLQCGAELQLLVSGGGRERERERERRERERRERRKETYKGGNGKRGGGEAAHNMDSTECSLL